MAAAAAPAAVGALPSPSWLSFSLALADSESRCLSFRALCLALSQPRPYSESRSLNAWDDSDKAQLDQDAVNFFFRRSFQVFQAVFNLKNGTLTSYAWASEDEPKLTSTL